MQYSKRCVHSLNGGILSELFTVRCDSMFLSHRIMPCCLFYLCLLLVWVINYFCPLFDVGFDSEWLLMITFSFCFSETIC